MSCKSKYTNKQFLNRRGIFEPDTKNLNGDIVSNYEIVPEKINNFNELNISLTAQAVREYDLKTTDLLYDLEDRSKIRDITKKSDGSIYRGATNIKYIALLCTF